MNPIMLAGLYGLAKGFALQPTKLPHKLRVHAILAAPIIEETMYRWVPAALGGGAFLNGLSAAKFALDHVNGEGTGLGRFADVFIGGIIYERAFIKYGLLGAITAHMAHNIAVGLGAR